MKNFAQVIAGLVLLTIVLILAGLYINSSRPAQVNPAQVAATEARIARVGEVYAGDTGAAAAAEAAAAAAEAAKGQIAYGGTLDGADIFNQLCAACHTSGAGGAPKMVKAEWGARIAQGADTLHKHAIEGFQGSAGIMPARGGNPSLSDEQVIAAVDWMVANLK